MFLRPNSLLLAALLLVTGCGINKSRLATEQLVVSEAVDKAVASIDFSSLSGRKVFLDTQYLEGVNMGPNGNVKYVISSLRQQMTAYDVRLQEKADTADYIVEARVGVLSNDGYEVTYGIPGNAAAVSATMLLASPVPIPAPGMPELSIGRRNHQAGTAKIGLFAYDRTTREPVWQAGIKRGTSDVRDTWFLGLGPYHYRPKRGIGFWPSKAESAEVALDPLTAYNQPIVFERAVRPSAPAATSTDSAVVPVSGEQGSATASPPADRAPTTPSAPPAAVQPIRPPAGPPLLPPGGPGLIPSSWPAPAPDPGALR
jgi:hypothetical protein